MNRIENIISLLKANTGKPVNNADVAKFATFNEAVTLETISGMIMVESPLKPALKLMPVAEVVDQMFMSVFGYTETQLDAIKATDEGKAGFQYWVDELKNNGDVVNINTLAIALLNGAAPGDEARAKANVAAEYKSYLNYDPEVPTEAPTDEPEIDGDVSELTSGTDKIVGTDKNDEFIADLAQNSFVGGVSNTLSSADKLDGGKGIDSLHAEIVPEFFGATGDRQIDIQPKTTSIENVTFEAREFGSNDTETETVSIDAKYMYGVNKIGSKNSDGDLIIENLTTLASDGKTIRNTSDITITMDHTDDKNTDNDASDLKVLFDEDYLISGQATSNATLTVRLLNAVQNASKNNPVEGFSEIVFKVGTEEIKVDITAIANDTSLDFTTAYQKVVDAINAELVDKGFLNVSASANNLENAVFSIPVAGYKTGDSAGQYYPIVISNTGSEALTGVEIETYALSYDTDLNNSFSTTAPVIEDIPLSVNIELTKVGRDGEGGNLIIGGKGDDHNGDTDVDQTDGIEQFNITVKGDESKPSNLGYITSTNGALDKVYIKSETRTDNSYAALTVRGVDNGAAADNTPFGNDLTLLNANDFKGDLIIGEDVAATNIKTFTATGGGDVYLNEVISEDGAGAGSFASLDNNAYSVTTGAGNDEIIVDANSGAQLTINSGAGNDDIFVTIDGQDDSGSDLTTASIVSGDGADTVTVTSSTGATHDATIITGAGDDTINGGAVNITVEAGSGNDTIYAENTATRTVAGEDVLDSAQVIYTAADVNTDLGTATVTANTSGVARPYTIDAVELLYGRKVTVTLATQGLVDAVALTSGFESLAVSIVASNGYLTTEKDLNDAIAKAINNDAVLSKLAEASVDSMGKLTVNYLVDGALDNTANDIAISYTISNKEISTGTDANIENLTSAQEAGILEQLKALYKDSGIDAAGLQDAFDDITLTGLTQDLAYDTNGTNSTDNTVNVINGGLGNDVIVLNSDANSAHGTLGNEVFDTIEIDAGGFGNDTIVNFTVGTNQAAGTTQGDVIDFKFLDNKYDISTETTSVGHSANHIDVTLVAATAMTNNTVTVVDFSVVDAIDGSTTNTFANLTDAQVLAALKDASGTFDVGTVHTSLVGNVIKSILMIQNDGNEGEYKVYEVTSDKVSDEFTSAKLVGSLDFGAEQTFVADNFIVDIA